MIVLGIESSCDETAAAIVRADDTPRVLASAVATQHELHAEYGGVVPEIASRAHAERLIPTLRAACADAGRTLADIDAVAVGHRPGLIGSLLVGVSAAKAIAWSLSKPLVGVDHVRAHLYAPLLDAPAPEWPAIGLVVSGGHTSIYRMTSPADLHRLGATIDDAIGEAFDKVAAMLTLGHPGGPEVERTARAGDDRAFGFPISRLSKDSLDFSFSGLKTAVLYETKGRPAPRPIPGKPRIEPEPVPELTDQRRADLCASFQHAAIAAIELKLTRALDRHPSARSLLVGGGVAANTPLRDRLAALCVSRNLALRLASMPYCVDNAAMIAGLGAELLRTNTAADTGLHLRAHPAASI